MDLSTNGWYVREYDTEKDIEMVCKGCERKIASFDHAINDSRTEWKMSIRDLHWNHKLKFDGGEIYCECYRHLGEIIGDYIISLKKSSISLVY